MSFNELSSNASDCFVNVSQHVVNAAMRVFGLGCVLMGFAMILTLWLIPFGVPLALTGVAFAFSSNDPIR